MIHLIERVFFQIFERRSVDHFYVYKMTDKEKDKQTDKYIYLTKHILKRLSHDKR